MSLITAVIRRYQKNGIRGVYLGTRDLLDAKWNDVLSYFGPKYWIFRGSKSISCNDYSATFLTQSSEECHEIEYFINNEMAVLSDIINEIHPGETFYDIGANLGIYSVFSALCGANTIAVEPYPPNVRKLQSNITQNEVGVKIVESALGADKGTIQLSSSSGGQIGSVGISTSGSGIETNLKTLDSIVADEDYSQPDVMKIDVEGAEGLVLEGSHDALQKCRIVYLELHYDNAFGVSTSDYGYTAEEVLSIFDKHGFKTEILVNKPNQAIVKASRSSK